MFAFPALHLSRAEIEAKLSSKRKGGTSPDSQADSGRGTSSPTSTSQNRLSGGISATFQQLLASALRLDHSKSSSPSPKPDEEVPKPTLLREDFGLNPRPAPSPPSTKRTSAPPDDWWERPRKSSSPAPVQMPVAEVKEDAPLPPVIPAKSSKRQKSKGRPTSDIFRALEEDPFNGGGSFSRRKNKKSEVERAGVPTRSLTVPARAPVPMDGSPVRAAKLPIERNTIKDEFASKDSVIGSPESSTSTTSSGKLVNVRGGRVEKANRVSGGWHAMRMSFDEPHPLSDASTATSGQTIEGVEGQTPWISLPEAQLPWRRQQRGETVSMLMRSGFFQAYDSNMENGSIASGQLSIPDKELPPTPGSVLATPTELYDDSAPLRPLLPAVRPANRNRKVSAKRQSPLSQLSAVNTRMNRPRILASPEAILPDRLSAIQEYTPLSENSPPPSGASTPVATQIHLRGGSVVTVCPPELTAWQRRTYLPGPVKLPTPTIIPRKNSVASLEAFQEAIDQVYQTALATPRRRSDEQVADDVCGFFDDFGFEQIDYTGDDILRRPPSSEDGFVTSMTYIEAVLEGDVERFSTPPLEPEVGPADRVVAKGVVDTTTSRPLPTDFASISGDEALCARGTDRLSAGTRGSPVWSGRHVRRDSGTLALSEEDDIPNPPGFRGE